MKVGEIFSMGDCGYGGHGGGHDGYGSRHYSHSGGHDGYGGRHYSYGGRHYDNDHHYGGSLLGISISLGGGRY